MPGTERLSFAAQDLNPSVSTPEVLRLVFSGNDKFSDKELDELAAGELENFFESDFPEAKADDAAYLIETFYRKAGYHFARVSYQISSLQDTALIEFAIGEGPQVQVDSLVITGNTNFSDKEILSFFAGEKQKVFGLGDSLFVESEIQDAVSSVRNLYTSDGFLEVRVELAPYIFSRDRSTVEIHLHINEGLQTVVGEILYKGEILEEAQSLLQNLSEGLSGKPFLARRKLMLRNGVQEIYGNLGYPDVLVKIKEKREEGSSKVGLACFVTSGPLVTVAAIEVVGNERTSAEFIKKRISLQPGDVYNSKKKRESFKKLYKTGLFSRVTLTLKKGKLLNERLLEIRVEEALAREVFFHGGWGSYELLRASTGFLDKNIFGQGRTFRLEVGGSVKSSNAETMIRDPWILGSNIIADLSVFFRNREEPSFTREESGASILFSKKFGRLLSASLRYMYSSTTTKDVIASAADEPESDYTIASVKMQTTYDNRDDILFPSTGHKVFGSAEIAEPAMGSGLSFYRFNAGIRKFFPLSTSKTLALRYDTGVILPGRNQVSIPIGERYFNGGENTVRSFLESELGPRDSSGDPLGGMAFNVFSVELRCQLIDNLVGSLFVDYGNISPNVSPEQEGGEPFKDRQDVIDRTLDDYFSDFRPAVGMGIQYLLPVGPARLDFAWNPDQDKERDEDEFTLHFSIGMAF